MDAHDSRRDIEATTGLSSAHNSKGQPTAGGMMVRARGGQLVRLRPDRPGGPTPRKGGGTRKRIYDDSRQSRKRHLDLLNSIDTTAVDRRGAMFFTLTYPGAYSRRPKDWKEDLNRLHSALRWRLGAINGVWRLEFQERGAPEFHLLLLLKAISHDELDGLRDWLGEAWHKATRSENPKHAAVGTQVDRVRSWPGAIAYVAKPTKGETPRFADPDTGEMLSIGRFWGVWGKPPISLVSVPLTAAQMARGRRVLARVRRQRKRVPQATVSAYMPASEGEKLEAFLMSS